ncbi:MAG: STAS domain-containing protein [Bryobacteraceae bacterium]
MAEDKLQINILDGSHPAEKVMVLDGVLNAETAFRFRDLVNREKATILIIDMTRVRYVDSSGLGVLIGVYVSFERNCRRLLLAGVNDRIWDLFRICKVDDVFTRYPTVSQAEQTVSV